MKRTIKEEKLARLEHVNALIETISKYGRRFFYNEKNNCVASMMVSKTGHIWFQDDYTRKMVYVAYTGRWRGFSHGGTLKALIERLAEYVRYGKKIEVDWIGPERFDDSNIWGYSQEQMALCRAEALLNPIIKVAP